jgi:hypothetical protein
VKAIAAALLAVLLLLAAIGGSYALGAHALRQSQHQWCAALHTLTLHPVPRPADPAANPSRVQSWEFFDVELPALKHNFGCR